MGSTEHAFIVAGSLYATKLLYGLRDFRIAETYRNYGLYLLLGVFSYKLFPISFWLSFILMSIKEGILDTIGLFLGGFVIALFFGVLIKFLGHNKNTNDLSKEAIGSISIIFILLQLLMIFYK